MWAIELKNRINVRYFKIYKFKHKLVDLKYDKAYVIEIKSRT